MVKNQLSIRIEKSKIDSLKDISRTRGVTYAELIRAKIDEILNGHDEATKNKVKQIVKELREPFVYFTTQLGGERAAEEKEKREKIALVIEGAFMLE